MVSIRSSVIILLLMTVAWCQAQGGAAGYGQGGGSGGGMGGGMAGGGGFEADPNAPLDDRKARPDEEEDPRFWTTRTAVLTPGDRVEFKLDVKKGETLLASATSDAFDPALAVIDSKGKVLKENDDRVEGDQSPFIVYRFPEDGRYTLKVLSFRSVSGGKFTAKLRTFLSTEAPMAPVVHNVPLTTEFNGRSIVRIAAKKDRIYDLRSPTSEVRYQPAPNLIRIIGPTGVERSDFERIPTSDSAPVIKALSDGDIYVEYQAYNPFPFRTDFREAGVVTMKTSGDLSLDLASGDLQIVEFPVKKEMIVRTTLNAPAVTWRLSSPSGPTVQGGSGDPGYGNNSYWAWFLMNRDRDTDVVRVFHAEGTARLAIRSSLKGSQKVTIANSESLPTWSSGQTVSDQLKIGDVRLFLIRSTKSELMKVFAASSQFQAKLDLFRMNGERANTLMNRETHTATDDLYFPEPDTFIVRLSCDGYGGSGPFTMKRETLTAVAYTLGTPKSITLDGANFGLYSVELKAGQRYQLTTDEPQKSLRADLLDEDGQFLVSQRLQFDKVDVQYFVPTRTGIHRLWLRGEPGTRHFKFEIHVPPVIGGT